MKIDKRIIGYGSRLWQTKDGIVMTWSEMSVTHLRNAASFIRRRASHQVHAAYSFSCMLTGEQAQFDTDNMIKDIEEEEAEIMAYAKAMEEYADYRDQHVQDLKERFNA